ncbi:hypothetical protein AYI69_g5118 [Smittium culicis]|uniref:Chitin-binding type-2 domain-containing protein n=1 Tax=Smittium culicis TaxID=133412 RepID=A0A1R1Y898_9FUNG|nr:hypothetical protein AYI69_g5118 [Smittium culicis]
MFSIKLTIAFLFIMLALIQVFAVPQDGQDNRVFDSRARCRRSERRCDPFIRGYYYQCRNGRYVRRYCGDRRICRNIGRDNISCIRRR